MKLNVALFLILLAASCTYAQTAADIQSKYGKSVEVYSVSEHIWMTPEYASDGQVCRMRLYPKRISGNTNYGAQDLPFNELRDVLSALVPVETRGVKQGTFGATATGGGASWTTYGYKNVTVTLLYFLQPQTYDGVILKRGEYVFPSRDSASPPTKSVPTSNDLVEWISTRTEVATITWNERKCAGQ